MSVARNVKMYLLLKGCNINVFGNKIGRFRMWLMVEVMGYQLVSYTLKGQELLIYLCKKFDHF